MRCNRSVARIPLKICVFLRIFLHSPLHSSRKISMVSTMKKRRFSGTLVVEDQSDARREDASAGAIEHTSRCKSKIGKGDFYDT